MSMPNISIIPATPLPSTPSSPVPPGLNPPSLSTTDGTSTQLATVPVTPKSGRPCLAPLRVCTSPDVLQKPISDRPRSGSLTPTCSPTKSNGSIALGLSPTSPLMPDIPQAPSPTTARRRRLSKLRRHLGEGVPPELVFSPRGRSRSLTLEVPLERSDSGSSLVFEKQENLIGMQSRVYDTDFGSFGRIQHRRVSVEPRVDVTRLVESDATDDEDDDISLGSDVLSDEYHWVVSRASRIQISSPTPGESPRRAAQRYSKRWYREKGGNRWEENDYPNLLKQLRSL